MSQLTLIRFDHDNSPCVFLTEQVYTFKLRDLYLIVSCTGFRAEMMYQMYFF